jgi:hypothetical protein
MVSVPKFALLRFGEWDAILKEPQPAAAMKVSTAMWRYMRAMAYAAKGDRAAAGREREAFETARKGVAADAAWGQNKAADILALASELVAAKMGEDPVGRLRKAVELQDAHVYDEPPAWYYPLRESLGAALLRAGQAAEAEKVFREGVRRSPRNGRMLFGLWEALKAQGRSEDAAMVGREFEAAWAKADGKLTVGDLF